MSQAVATTRTSSLEAHFMGVVDFDAALRLQRRLAFEISDGTSPNVTLLMCEHPRLISIGRGGSRRHIRLSEAELKHRRLDVRFVARGGGCVLHGPGQLAIYPIVSLNARGWSVGEYLARLQQAIVDTLHELRVHSATPGPNQGVAGRTGQLATIGIAVRDGVTTHGAYLNGAIEPGASGYVDVVAPDNIARSEKTTMTSILSETGRPARMSSVRAELAPQMAAAFDCPRFHLHTGHEYLRS